jgi:hypothetical protein
MGALARTHLSALWTLSGTAASSERKGGRAKRAARRRRNSTLRSPFAVVLFLFVFSPNTLKSSFRPKAAHFRRSGEICFCRCSCFAVAVAVLALASSCRLCLELSKRAEKAIRGTKGIFRAQWTLQPIIKTDNSLSSQIIFPHFLPKNRMSSPQTT